MYVSVIICKYYNYCKIYIIHSFFSKERDTCITKLRSYIIKILQTVSTEVRKND